LWPQLLQASLLPCHFFCCSPCCSSLCHENIVPPLLADSSHSGDQNEVLLINSITSHVLINAWNLLLHNFHTAILVNSIFITLTEQLLCVKDEQHEYIVKTKLNVIHQTNQVKIFFCLLNIVLVHPNPGWM
jgi:hypothetical protein